MPLMLWRASYASASRPHKNDNYVAIIIATEAGAHILYIIGDRPTDRQICMESLMYRNHSMK